MAQARQFTITTNLQGPEHAAWLFDRALPHLVELLRSYDRLRSLECETEPTGDDDGQTNELDGAADTAPAGA